MEKRKKAMSAEPPTKIVKLVDDFQSVFPLFQLKWNISFLDLLAKL